MRGYGHALTALALVLVTACGREREQVASRLLRPRPSAALVASGPTVAWDRGEVETNRIDLLLVFDRKAQKWTMENASGDCVAFAQESVESMNACLAQTGLDACFTFRLAGVEILDRDFSKRDPLDLAHRASGMSPPAAKDRKCFQRLHRIRQRCKADIVVILSDDFAERVGGGVQLDAMNYSAAVGLEFCRKYAYCACEISRVRGRQIMLHEIGHIMGAGHGRDMWSGDSSPGARDFAMAHVFRDGEKLYTTVMGYPRPASQGEPIEVMPCFSSPDYETLSGVAVGTVSNDNTRILRETYAIVANFNVAKKRKRQEVSEK